jgi:hypothetical protein
MQFMHTMLFDIIIITTTTTTTTSYHPHLLLLDTPSVTKATQSGSPKQ